VRFSGGDYLACDLSIIVGPSIFDGHAGWGGGGALRTAGNGCTVTTPGLARFTGAEP
jgi:hypothetical protein